MNTEIRNLRRQELVTSATRVFARRGYRATSIDDIVKEADIARGTFYLYFESKVDVFNAIFDSFLMDLKTVAQSEARRPVDLTDVPTAVRGVIVEWLRYFSQNRDLAAVMFSNGASVDPDFKKKCAEVLAGMYARWEQSIEMLRKLGVGDPRLSPEFIRVSMVGMVSQIVLHYIVPDPKADIEHLADQCLVLVTPVSLPRRGEN